MFDTFSLICQYFFVYENNKALPPAERSLLACVMKSFIEFYALLYVLVFDDHHGHGPIKCQVKTGELSVQSKRLSCFDGLPVAIS